jgi:2,3-bisphosphoglycerate-independent phosphoglycerate mutase
LPAAIGVDAFSGFERGDAGIRRVACMTQYDVKFPFPAIFRPEQPPQVLAQVLSDAGLSQFHCAETEKRAHVTYFFNGGRDAPFPREERDIVPSPRIATYDLKPEMSASGVADRVIDAIERERYHFIVMNFANGDMVGHTANPQAVMRAVETLDLQSHRVIGSALAHGFRIMLTADHGNCEEMVDPVSGQPHTQHTVYPVPFLIVGEPGIRLGTGRGLRDVAPTVLDLLGLSKPDVMTGSSLILKSSLEL